MNTVASILQSVAAVVVAGVAIAGFFLWRREMVGKRKMEAAERALTLFYQVKNTLEWVRFPGSNPHESANRPKGENESPEDSRDKDVYYVPIARLIQEKDSLAELGTLRFSFMALFGKDNIEPFNTIKNITSQIQVASFHLGRSVGRRVSSERQDEHNKRLEDVIWYAGEDDPINKRLDKAVAQIEETCRPYLEGKAIKRWEKFKSYLLTY